jgi:predicted enzyme related to lactoylglutathione lyase
MNDAQLTALRRGWLRRTGRGLVVVTSRVRDASIWGRDAEVREVLLLSEQEAAQVLLDLAPNAADADDHGREQQARELARQLGYLPLALHLAGTYLGNPGGREHHPELRQQMANAGAPAGFEDVVGGIIPIADDQPDTPPHWSVTFATADADATAAKATELGGRVIVPPFDAPWSTDTYTIRIAVVRDPQEATFTASKFVPKNKNLGG